MDDKLEAVFELIRNGLILLNMTTEGSYGLGYVCLTYLADV